MKVLIIDSFSKAHLESLKAAGLDVDYQPQLKADELPQKIGDAGILVARSKVVSAAAIEAATQLQLIVRAGAGVNTIDVKAAAARAIYVANCPGKNAVAVAELTMGLLLSLDRRIADQVADLRAGKWDKKRYSEAGGLLGRTLGVIGTGSIGQEVIRRAQAFGMNVIAWSRSLTDERAAELDVRRMPDIVSLCKAADAITVHVALTKDTRGLVNEAAFAAMQTGAMFVNAARAEVVDSAAMRRAIAEKKLRVGLDVFDKEPTTGTGEFADDVVKSADVYGTHHVGASTDQAQAAVADEAVRIIREFVSRGEVPNCVNLAERSPAKFQLQVRHYDKVGVLAEVLSAIRRSQINVEEMENIIFEGAQAASARIRLASRPSEELLSELRARSEEIIFVDVVEL